MSLHRMNADTHETLAGVVRLLVGPLCVRLGGCRRRKCQVSSAGAGVGHRPGRRGGTEPATGCHCGRRTCTSEMQRQISYAPPSSCCGASREIAPFEVSVISCLAGVPALARRHQHIRCQLICDALGSHLLSRSYSVKIPSLVENS